jgi:hypothetical protein
MGRMEYEKWEKKRNFHLRRFYVKYFMSNMLKQVTYNNHYALMVTTIVNGRQKFNPMEQVTPANL